MSSYLSLLHPMMWNKMVYSSVSLPGNLIVAVRRKRDFLSNKSILDVQCVRED